MASSTPYDVRDGSGRWAPKGAPRQAPAPFDLSASLQALFTRAVDAGDATGAASLARVLKEIAPDPHAFDPNKRLDDGTDDIEFLTREEHDQLQQLLAGYREIKARVNELRAIGRKRMHADEAKPEWPRKPEPPRRVAVEPVAPAPAPTLDPDEMLTVMTLRGPQQIKRRDLDKAEVIK